MKTAKELYPDAISKDGYFWGAYNYQPIIENLGHIAVQVDDDDYQGDTRILYHNGGNIGYLNFGWGSCSGCDALQSCDSYEEIQELMDSLCSDVKWFGSKLDALEYFENKDWELEYSWHANEQKRFIEEVKQYLRNKE